MSGKKNDDQQKLVQNFDLVIFFILSSNIPLDFYEFIQVVSLKYLMYFLAGINTN